jgi:hypothetical protein
MIPLPNSRVAPATEARRHGTIQSRRPRRQGSGPPRGKISFLAGTNPGFSTSFREPELRPTGTRDFSCVRPPNPPDSEPFFAGLAPLRAILPTRPPPRSHHQPAPKRTTHHHLTHQLARSGPPRPQKIRGFPGQPDKLLKTMDQTPNGTDRSSRLRTPANPGPAAAPASPSTTAPLRGTLSNMPPRREALSICA